MGWSIIIFRAEGTGCIGDPNRIASWRTGVNGKNWLDEMVRTGTAELVVSNGGYPFQYKAMWKHVLPELLTQPTPYEGPPVIGDDYVMNRG